MSILSDGSKIVADLKQTNIFGQKGIGLHQLIFQVEFLLKTWNEFETNFRNLSAEVFITDRGNNDHLLGVAYPETPFIEKTPDKRDREAYSNLKILLTPHQIELIEGIRKGQDFKIKLKISCELNTRFFDERQDINRSHREEVFRSINQSEWIKVLERMGFGKYFLLEVPFPIELDEVIPKRIHEELLSAQNHFFKGHYDVTVSKCRKVFELLENLLNDKGMVSKSMNSFKGTKNQRDSMTKEERFYMIRKTIYHYTHLAHHSENNGNITQFNRIEAQQILSMVTSTLTYFLSEK